MNLNPIRSDIIERGSILRRIALAIFGLVLSGLALAFALYWVPSYINGIVRWQTYENEEINATRYYGKMFDAMKGYFEPYAEELLTLEKLARETRLTRADFEKALALPNVQEVFWIDISKGIGKVEGSVLALSDILNDTTISREQQRVPLPDTLKPWKSLGYSFRNINGIDYTIAIREVKPFGKAKSHETVGLILLTEPILEEGTKKLTRLFADPLETEFRGQSANGRQGSFGLLRGNDTIWWWGDRDVTIINEQYDYNNKEWHHPGWVIPISGVNVTIVGKGEELASTVTVEKASKLLERLLREIVVIGLVFIYLLGFSLVLANRQSRRNQIALGHLAHSVKTPVARLQLAADILEGGQVSSPEEERKIIQTVSGECRQLRRAVENAALTMEGGKIAIHKEPGDLAELVKETVDTWQQSFDQAGIKLSVEGVDKPLQASFDREKLKLALDNLVDNALRHTYLNLKKLKPGQAFVALSVHHEDTKISVSVTDAGAGIPKADMKHVFKRFSHSGKDPLTGVSGLGLGLALVKEIVEGHGGKVKVETAQGGGAKFVIQMTND